MFWKSSKQSYFILKLILKCYIDRDSILTNSLVLRIWVYMVLMRVYTIFSYLYILLQFFLRHNNVPLPFHEGTHTYLHTHYFFQLEDLQVKPVRTPIHVRSVEKYISLSEGFQITKIMNAEWKRDFSANSAFTKPNIREAWKDTFLMCTEKKFRKSCNLYKECLGIMLLWMLKILCTVCLTVVS